MAKDPAVLFYTSDFLTGVRRMTYEQVGKYITLLCMQHQYGSLTEKDMLHICGTYDEDIWCKFEKTDAGFLNKRMHEEAEKRKRYSESRRNNKIKGIESKHMTNICESYDKHMENENENENINTLVPKKKEKVKKNFEAPTIEQVVAYFLEKGYSEKSARRAFAHYEAGDWYDSNGRKVKSWKQKMTSVWFTDENKQVDNFDSPNEIEKYRGLKGFDEQIHTCGLYYPHLENDEDGNKKIKYYPHGYRP